ncbi:MAG: hypothetical protein ABR528_13190 [Pseudonocardiaceae bacterium]
MARDRGRAATGPPPRRALRRRGHSTVNSDSASPAGLDRQVAELREELHRLRAQDDVANDRVPSKKPAPPTDA